MHDDAVVLGLLAVFDCDSAEFAIVQQRSVTQVLHVTRARFQTAEDRLHAVTRAHRGCVVRLEIVLLAEDQVLLRARHLLGDSRTLHFRFASTRVFSTCSMLDVRDIFESAFMFLDDGFATDPALARAEARSAHRGGHVGSGGLVLGEQLMTHATMLHLGTGLLVLLQDLISAKCLLCVNMVRVFLLAELCYVLDELVGSLSQLIHSVLDSRPLQRLLHARRRLGSTVGSGLTIISHCAKVTLHVLCVDLNN